MDERIVCAANKHYANGTILLGVRHWDAAMRDAAYRHSPLTPVVHSEYKQGFITNKWRWVDRQEAWKIAQAEGQIIRRVGGDDSDGGTLYSENLY